MREIGGHLIPETIDELSHPSRTALLIIDIQNDFCTEGGALHRNGYDVSYYGNMIQRTRRLLDAARAAGTLCVFVQNTTLPGWRSDSAAWVRFRVRTSRDPSVPALQCTIAGTWGHQIVDGLAPRPDEIVVPKFRSSAFVGTPLDLLLRSNRKETILLTGCTTEGCVESTARDGMFLDYEAVVVRDCVESDTREQHEASLTLMKNRFELVSSEDVMRAWSQVTHPASEEAEPASTKT
jgi:nicotinamidase-related amidase